MILIIDRIASAIGMKKCVFTIHPIKGNAMTNFNLKLFAVVLIALLISATTISAHEDSAGSQSNNIVETASGAGQFETLLAAATAAGLVPALTGEGPLTVFAPTDDAFGALPAGTIEALLKEENRDQLVRILSYHVVSGQIGSNALADEVSLKTLAGPKVTFIQSENGFTVEGARIVATDIAASNGVIHVIDRVIMPPQQMSRASAERMIMSAISRGAPMFNHGNPKGTVEIYSMAVQTLMESADLKKNEVARLQKALEDSAASGSYQEKAWDLRYALDDVIRSLRATGNMSS